MSSGVSKFWRCYSKRFTLDVWSYHLAQSLVQPLASSAFEKDEEDNA